MVETLHLQYFLGALVSLIVITNPLSKLPLFVSLTQGMSEERRRQQALWAGIYSAAIMLVSLLGGNMLLAFFGISYGAMRIAGGLVVAMIGYQMLFGGNTPNNAPIVRRDKDDYAFFPIAMPGIAGPGTIAVVIGFSTEIAELKDYVDLAVALGWTAAAIIVTASASWAVMRYSDLLTRRLGPSGTLVLGKLMGFILICIGVQFVGSGIRTFMAGA
ncbi:MAG TPA: MarC family NAAT transporter [Candidatus Sutterella merdavium]|jgi:multiple antibiotic resistance protein|nr:MarC family NAAT transporter [Candidatus Sutterella merdavium]